MSDPREEDGWEIDRAYSDLTTQLLRSAGPWPEVARYGGLVAFALLDRLVFPHEPWADVGIRYFLALPFLYVFLLIAPLVVLHEICHGLPVTLVGGRVTYKFFPGGKAMAHVKLENWISHRLMLFLLILPTIVVNLLLIGFVLLSPPMLRAVFVMAAAQHLWGCVTDWRMFAILSRLPPELHWKDSDGGLGLLAGRRRTAPVGTPN